MRTSQVIGCVVSLWCAVVVSACAVERDAATESTDSEQEVSRAPEAVGVKCLTPQCFDSCQDVGGSITCEPLDDSGSRWFCECGFDGGDVFCSFTCG
jgi:hypothetical protein